MNTFLTICRNYKSCNDLTFASVSVCLDNAIFYGSKQTCYEYKPEPLRWVSEEVGYVDQDEEYY